VKRRTLIALLAVSAFSLGLVACGDDDDDEGTTATAATETTGTPDATETSEATEVVSGREGPLTAGGVGPVERGASTGETEQAFGPADGTETAVGCELAGPNAPEVLTWTYDLGEGELLLTFDPASGKLVYYRTRSPSLETTLGDRVGDEFAGVRDNWGSDLKKFPLGQVTAQEGIWAVSEGPENKLMFEIQGGKVTAILGGFVQICE
jgi:hypothetical protein